MSYSSFQELKVVITAAQLLTLHTAPVLLVPGQAGCVIEIESLYYRYFHGSVQFNPATADQIAVVFGSTSSSSNPNVNPELAKGFVDQAVDMSCWASPSWGLNGVIKAFPLATYKGQGLSLMQYGATFPTGANWAQGNGQLAVFLKYAYIEV
jgi:hypothetical protein